MRQLLHTLAMAIALLLLVACSKEKTISEAYTDYLYDVVTYTGNDPSTGWACFELVGRDVAPSIMLRGNLKLDSTVVPPKRVLLRYAFADDNTTASTRNIKMYGVTSVITDSLRVIKGPVKIFAQHPVKMRSAWRTGDFINLHCQVEHTGKPRTMMMIIDDATRYQDTVHCYLNHDLRTDTAYFWRECYVSINVGNVWKRTQCKTLRLHVNDANRGTLTYDFNRK